MTKSIKILPYLSSLSISLVVCIGGISEQAKAVRIDLIGTEVKDEPLDLIIQWEWNGESARLKPPSNLDYWEQINPLVDTTLDYFKPLFKPEIVQLRSLRYRHKPLNFETHVHNTPGDEVFFQEVVFNNKIDGLFNQSINSKPLEHDKHFDGYTITFIEKALGKGGTLTLVGKHRGSKSEVPEPLTILGSLTALGFGTVFKKRYSKNIEKKTA